MRRTSWAMAIALPVLFVSADIVYWQIAAQRLRSGYEKWLAARIGEGWQTEAGPLSVSGWPRAATIAIQGLTLRHDGTAIPGNLAVTSSAVILSISLFNPKSLKISSVGPINVRFNDSPEIILVSEQNWLSVPLRQYPPFEIDLHASNLRISSGSDTWKTTAGLLDVHATISTDPVTTEAGTGRARTDLGDTQAGVHRDARNDETGTGVKPAEPSAPPVVFSVSAEAIALPTAFKWSLGTNISSVSLDGQINGPLPATRNITAWAEAWRDGGGSLDIAHLALGWGPLGVTSSATLALDEQLQPMGSGSGRFVGYAAALDRLAAGGTLTKSAATAAKAILSLMAGSTEANEPSVVDVPLTLQYRTLSMRQVPMLRLPELDWPAR